MHLKTPRGFTLIELLVVIAIIGILSAIIFSSLAEARTKAADNTVKSGMVEIRSQIELSSATNFANAYSNTFTSATCPTTSSAPDPIFYSDTKIRTMIASVSSENHYGSVKCAAGGSSATAASSWAIASPLPSTGGGATWWCIDSSGQSKLSFSGHRKGFIERLLTLTNPTAFAAAALGPNLGGGASAAVCP